MDVEKPDLAVEGETREEAEVAEPPLYRVFLHNDDFTPRAFVVAVLVVVFHKPEAEAAALMWQAHHHGVALCGIYPLELAETRVARAHEAARESGFPLRFTLEEDRP